MREAKTALAEALRPSAKAQKSRPLRTSRAPFQRPSLKSFARDVSAILLYAGFAWGAGAFLVLASDAGIFPTVLFAAAHSLAMAGSRIGFQKPLGYPSRIGGFDLAVGATEVVSVLIDVFDRFEFPFGRPWDHANLRVAVADAVSAAAGRINLRNPGLLLLSPGTALAGYDEALIEAVKAVVPSLGRKNRGLMAVAPIVLRLQPMPDPQAIRIGYGLFPVQNRRYAAPG